MPIRNDDHAFILECGGMSVTLDKESLAVKVNTGTAVWETAAGGANVMRGEERTALHAAKEKSFTPIASGYFEGVLIRLGQFACGNGASEAEDALFMSILLNTHNKELLFELHDGCGEAGQVDEVVWPGAFRFPSGPESDYTVIPAMQGYIVPASWEQPVLRYHNGMMFGRDAYMPWWGQLRGNNGYLAIIETPDDSRLSVEHIPQLHTLAEAVWVHSHGGIRYSRKLRMTFGEGMDYVAMAKGYRKHVVGLGNMQTLSSKREANPKLTRLMGAAVVHSGVHTHIVPESSYYDHEHPGNNDYVVHFEEKARQLAELKRRYGGKLYAHIDGWGLRGYDNLHPDILPPSPPGGGWKGLRKLQETCREEDILLALHDNYRDFYHDAASYHTSLTIKDSEGKQEYCDIWAGGAHSFLCTAYARGYMERNYDMLRQHGVEPDGAYIDVFAVVPGDECYDPAHPMTRSESLSYRKGCFQEIRSRGMIISSEEPADWAVPVLDLVHHAPYALAPGPGEGVAIGIPVPLFSLAYHDALIVPWPLEKGAWGIPLADCGYLHGMLNAGVPYLSIQPSEEELRIVGVMAQLHERVGGLEMTGHEFVRGNRRKQRTTFSDGTSVEVDFDEEYYLIKTTDGTVIER
ncbi:DUF5696 domain-containing protein [Paenibacillus sp. J5C_2022]|uniref:DUF5696 domain-containing protein n=1 Tax=Paenibacillus sp. J5C2022 TaxID=2977129 RepID=UPI0021D18CB6|nr:DUF5696 domain-containing protein [Paenibacillus sp. J5C2022]MCU6707752.1 DUF5696 domain-containing protein [Paenibacillus sp. J5C2022]